MKKMLLQSSSSMPFDLEGYLSTTSSIKRDSIVDDVDRDAVSVPRLTRCKIQTTLLDVCAFNACLGP